jgi:hypothetical protein
MSQTYYGFYPKNVVVGVEDNKLVGMLHIFDCGFPWTILDGFYLKPTHRTLKNALKIGLYAENELKSRGVKFISICAPEDIAKALTRWGYKQHDKPFRFVGKVF